MNKSTNETTDLALQGGNFLAKLLGIADPCVGIPLGTMIEVIQNRRTKRQSRQLHLLIESIGRQVRHIDENQIDDESINLFDEIIANAVSDEDEAKVEYYGALIGYVAEGNHHPFKIRILGGFLRQLTFYELQAFSLFSKNKPLPKNMPSDLVDSFWNRIEALGVFKGGSVKHPNNITKLGHALVIIIEKAEVA